jgi:hypothetical protein
VGLGLGLLGLVFTGALALRPARKPFPLPEETPTTLADASQSADAAKRFDALKRNTLAPKLQPSMLHEPAPTDEHEKITNLGELFAQLKDKPAPVIDFAATDIKLEKADCPGYDEFSGNVAVYDHGQFKGYLNIGQDSDMIGMLGHSLFRPIVNNGEEIGFRQANPMSPYNRFVSRGGKESSAYQYTESANFISAPEDHSILGIFNDKNEQFSDTEGKVLGKLDKDARYLMLLSTPQCMGENPQRTGFIKFSSLSKFESFENRIVESKIWGAE